MDGEQTRNLNIIIIIKQNILILGVLLAGSSRVFPNQEN